MAQPAPAVSAAALVAQLAAPLQRTRARREEQEKLDRPPPPSLENAVLRRLNQRTHLFLNLRRQFNQLPGALLELVNRSGLVWRCPPLVGLLATPRSKYLKIELFSHRENLHWTLLEQLDQLDQLCDSIAENCQDSLQRLEIHQLRFNDIEGEEVENTQMVLLVSQLGSMLLPLRSLTSFTLNCDYSSPREIDLLVSILATSNPHIRVLQLPYLSAKSLATIAHRWPEIEHLVSNRAWDSEITAAQIALALGKLRCVRIFRVADYIESEAMIEVSRGPDLGTWPVEGRFRTPEPPFSGRDLSGVFSCFPCFEEMTMYDSEIPQVVEGLKGRQTKITSLKLFSSSNPLTLRPLFETPMGRNLTHLAIEQTEYPTNRLNLALIGHYCKLLQSLNIQGFTLVASPDYEVDNTYFCKLTQFVRHHLTSYDSLPDALVCSLLAGPDLENFDSHGVSISEGVASSLAEGSGEGGALSSLREMIIWHGDASARALAIISSHAPRLRAVSLVVYGQPDQQLQHKRDVLTEFFRQGELPVVLNLIH